MAGTISSVSSGDAWRPAAWALEIPSAIVGRSSSPAVPLFNSKVAVSRGFTQPRASAPVPAATARSKVATEATNTSDPEDRSGHGPFVRPADRPPRHPADYAR